MNQDEKLYLKRLGDFPSIHKITHGELYIGREENAFVTCLSKFVSRKHLVLMRKLHSSQIFIKDLNTSNGTFLNNNRLYPGRLYPLNLNDTISLGLVGKTLSKDVYMFKLINGDAKKLCDLDIKEVIVIDDDEHDDDDDKQPTNERDKHISGDHQNQNNVCDLVEDLLENIFASQIDPTKSTICKEPLVEEVKTISSSNGNTVDKLTCSNRVDKKIKRNTSTVNETSEVESVDASTSNVKSKSLQSSLVTSNTISYSNDEPNTKSTEHESDCSSENKFKPRKSTSKREEKNSKVDESISHKSICRKKSTCKNDDSKSTTENNKHGKNVLNYDCENDKNKHTKRNSSKNEGSKSNIEIAPGKSISNEDCVNVKNKCRKSNSCTNEVSKSNIENKRGKSISNDASEDFKTICRQNTVCTNENSLFNIESAQDKYRSNDDENKSVKSSSCVNEGSKSNTENLHGKIILNEDSENNKIKCRKSTNENSKSTKESKRGKSIPSNVDDTGKINRTSSNQFTSDLSRNVSNNCCYKSEVNNKDGLNNKHDMCRSDNNNESKSRDKSKIDKNFTNKTDDSKIKDKSTKRISNNQNSKSEENVINEPKQGSSNRIHIPVNIISILKSGTSDNPDQNKLGNSQPNTTSDCKRDYSHEQKKDMCNSRANNRSVDENILKLTNVSGVGDKQDPRKTAPNNKLLDNSIGGSPKEKFKLRKSVSHDKSKTKPQNIVPNNKEDSEVISDTNEKMDLSANSKSYETICDLKNQLSFHSNLEKFDPPKDVFNLRSPTSEDSVNKHNKSKFKLNNYSVVIRRPIDSCNVLSKSITKNVIDNVKSFSKVISSPKMTALEKIRNKLNSGGFKKRKTKLLSFEDISYYQVHNRENGELAKETNKNASIQNTSNSKAKTRSSSRISKRTNSVSVSDLAILANAVDANKKRKKSLSDMSRRSTETEDTLSRAIEKSKSDLCKRRPSIMENLYSETPTTRRKSVTFNLPEKGERTEKRRASCSKLQASKTLDDSLKSILKPSKISDTLFLPDWLKDFLGVFLRWKPQWMNEYNECKNDNVNQYLPPIFVNNKLKPPRMSYVFKDFKQYSSTCKDLVALEIWDQMCNMHMSNMKQSLSTQVVGNPLPPSTCTNVTKIRCKITPRQINEVCRKTSFGTILVVKIEEESEERFAVVDEMNYKADMHEAYLSFYINLDAKTSVKHNTTVHINQLSTIRNEMMLIKALYSLESSPLCDIIISPTEFNFKKFSNQITLQWKHCLNVDQKKAVQQCTSAVATHTPNIQMIHGPPGTGKSKLIAAIVLEYFQRNYGNPSSRRKVLICSQSNIAVDDVIKKLINEKKKYNASKLFEMIRVGRYDSMQPWAQEISTTALAQKFNHTPEMQAQIKILTNNMEKYKNQMDVVGPQGIYSKMQYNMFKKKLEDLNFTMGESSSDIYKEELEIIRRADVIVSTLQGCSLSKMEQLKNKIAFCIIDEAAKSIEPEVLIPLALGVKCLIMVGDNQQLPGFIHSQHAKLKGLNESMFSRILQSMNSWKSSPLISLKMQYRMSPKISQFPNEAFYEGRLENGINYAPLPYLIPEYRVVHICGVESDKKLSRVNVDEAKVVSRIAVSIKYVIDMKKLNMRMCILTPYAAHRDILQTQLEVLGSSNIDVYTVDGFQGQERDVVIISLARNTGSGFLVEPGRMSVLLTRAKRSCIICCNPDFAQGQPLWESFLEDAKGRNCERKLPVNCCDKIFCSSTDAEPLLQYIS